MKNQNKMLCVILSFITILGITCTANALTVTDLYGDQDGFGLGVSEGQVFHFGTLATADPGTITDQWMNGVQSWTHTYSLTGLSSVRRASLEIFSGGSGTTGTLASISIDGQEFGRLSYGRSTDPDSPFPNIATIDIFDLTPYLAFIDGFDSLTVTTQANDGWVLDYSKLTVVVAPEPSTFVLLGGGLAGLLFAASRRKKK